MLWTLFACAPPPSSCGISPLLPGWQSLEVERLPVGALLSDGASTWAIDAGGGVMLRGEPWLDLGNEGFVTGGLEDADVLDGTLWALRDGAVEQFDGAVWSSIALPVELDGAHRLVARADGSLAVLAATSPTFTCDTPCPPATTNTLGLWDGTSWSVFPEGPTDPLTDLTETASGELVAVGVGGWVTQWDGASWVDLHRGEPGGLLSVVAHGDEIVAVGSEGLVVRGPLSALVVESAGSAWLRDVDVSESGQLWALGYTSAFVRDGDWEDGGWLEVPLPEGGGWHELLATDEGALVAGHHAGPTVLAGDSSGFVVDWHQPTLFWLQGVWMEDEDTTWLAAHDGVGRWDGAAFETWELPEGSVARALAGNTPDDLVVVGDGGVYEWNGAGFDLVWPEQSEMLWDVAVAPDGTAFVATSEEAADEGQTPRLLRRDAGVWSMDAAPIPTPARVLIAIAAFAADDVYALTWSSPVVLLHFDGTSWTELTSDLGSGYETLWGRSGSDLYLGKSSEGPGAGLLHWDGAALTEIPGAPAYVTSLAGTDTELLVGANDGWGDAYDPSATLWRDGAWTEVMRDMGEVTVGARGDTAVLALWSEVQRGPLSAF